MSAYRSSVAIVDCLGIAALYIRKEQRRAIGAGALRSVELRARRVRFAGRTVTHPQVSRRARP